MHPPVPISLNFFDLVNSLYVLKSEKIIVQLKLILWYAVPLVFVSGYSQKWYYKENILIQKETLDNKIIKFTNKIHIVK